MHGFSECLSAECCVREEEIFMQVALSAKKQFKMSEQHDIIARYLIIWLIKILNSTKSEEWCRNFGKYLIAAF